MWTDHSVWPYNQVVPFYRMLQNHPSLWRFFWYYGIFPVTTWLQEVITRRTCFKPFKEAIAASDPDLVVSVHPLCQVCACVCICGYFDKNDTVVGGVGGEY
jgi:1,2-diacylglycerol 3-beta-galactosyltransferase